MSLFFFFFFVNILILQWVTKLYNKVLWYFFFINYVILFFKVSLGFVDVSFFTINFEYIFTPEDKILLFSELLLDPIYSHLKPFDNAKIFSFIGLEYVSLINESYLLSDLLSAFRAGLDNLPYSFYVLLYGSKVINISIFSTILLVKKVSSLSLIYFTYAIAQFIFIPWLRSYFTSDLLNPTFPELGHALGGYPFDLYIKFKDYIPGLEYIYSNFIRPFIKPWL